MNYKPILIVCGESNSIFSEVLVKSFRKYKSKRPIVLVGSIDLINSQLQKLGLKLKLNLIFLKSNYLNNLKKDKVNIVNIDYNFKKPFEKSSSKSKKYISKCFQEAFKIINHNKLNGLINGPISKQKFLKGKYPGITEYICSNYNIKKNYAMLIYNKHLSVCPITTHLPISKVSKKIDVIIGMYHDQVLTPLKALQGFNAINVTLGLPFLRVSPDHGPNQKMIGKNKSDPQSLIEAIKFLNRFK